MEALKLNFLEREKGETQEIFVRRVLSTQGFISRNFCLRRYISRLGSRICEINKELRKTGFEWKGRTEKTYNGSDYVYRLEKIGGQ